MDLGTVKDFFTTMNAAYVGIAATVSAAAGGIVYARKVSKNMKAIMGLPGVIAQMQEILSRVHHELTPNSGSSLRDRVDSISTAVNMTTVRMYGQADMYTWPMLECDAKGSCTFANRVALETLGRSLADVRNDGWVSALAHPHIDLASAWTRAVNTGSSWEARALIKTKPYVVRMRALRHEDKLIGWTGTIESTDTL